MSDTDKDLSLAPDGAIHEPLKRNSYAPGMLLGIDATRREQDYHRRRLTRQQYWLHGAGTVCGLAVSAAGRKPDQPQDNARTRLVIAPGFGIDGLGREITVHEPYCIDLGAWLDAERDTADGQRRLLEGIVPGADELWLTVTMRYQDCESGLQPVLADKVNAGTDPVDAARITDSVLFELIAELPDETQGYHPWAGLPGAAKPTFTKDEQLHMDTLKGATKKRVELQAGLMYAFPPQDEVLQLDDALDELARTPLARARVPLRPDGTPHLNVDTVGINNLVRNFITTPGQLAWLAGQK